MVDVLVQMNDIVELSAVAQHLTTTVVDDGIIQKYWRFTIGDDNELQPQDKPVQEVDCPADFHRFLFGPRISR